MIPPHYFFLTAVIFLGYSNALTIDVAGKHGRINYDTVKLSIREAQAIFTQSPNTVINIKLRAGTHYLRPPAHKPQAILFSGSQPGPGGRLIFEGAGRSLTTIVVPKGFTVIRGRKVYRLTIRHMTLTRDQPLVSQGKIVQTGSGFVILQLSPGFPDALSIYDKDWGQGRFLRKYNYKNGRCTLVEHNNPQIAYSRIERLGGGRFKFILAGEYWNKNPNYSYGQMIGVKSKCCNKYGRELYWICGGGDIVLEHLRFMRSSRGVLRCGISNVRISNILIRKDNPGWCLATSGDGPNVGQPEDPPVTNVVIDHVVAEGTGDDSIALFNVKSGVVRNCKIRDSFARGILLYRSSGVHLYNNILTRNPELKCDHIPCRDANDVMSK